MPSISDIKISIRVPSCIKDTFIREGKFDTLPNGELVMYSGGFTSVFPVTVGSGKWAFRCWHTDLGNMRNRMEQVSSQLTKLSLPYFCEFSYLDEGIVVNGKIYPTTRMKWVQGQTIKDYICTHPQKKLLVDLAEKFLFMCQDLHKHRIAHGDLQHGNIMVDENGNLFLIDYDSMFVPSMQGQPDIITGLKDYQHPCRRYNKESSEKLDYFSELIIYTSILAIAENEAFLQKYDVENAERLLFSANDYKDLEHTEIYAEIESLGGIFPLLLHILKEYLKEQDISKLMPFDELANKYSLTPVIKAFEIVNGNVVYRNSKLTLQWEIENYTTLLLNGEEVKQPNMPFTETVSNDKEYSIIAINGLKKSTATLTAQVVDKPVISLKLSKSKLRKEKNEKSSLKWNIKDYTSAELVYENTKKCVPSSGNEILAPTETTSYELHVVGLDKRTVFIKKVILYILSESCIEFRADKTYSYPHLPIRLNWNVQHAKSVELVGFGSVNHIGDKIVEPSEDSNYVLKVTDAFGCQTRQITIKMLPLPVIKALMVPTPIIQHSISVNVTPVIMQAYVKTPKDLYTNIDIPPLVEADFKKLEVNMNGVPSFHSLDIKLKTGNWWSKIWNKLTKQKIHL